ncbi:MAG: hypothetical protein ACP5E4_01990 [Candidatus Aenigmatarchaeota archaeon]
MRLKNKEGITNSEALKILSDKMKKGELTLEQQQAYDFLKATVKLKEADAKKLQGELAKTCFPDEKILNIVNILPTDEATLKLILKDEKELKKEDLKKILDTVGKYI